MAKSSYAGRDNRVQEQNESDRPVGQVEDMPMNRYVHQIPLYQNCQAWGCRWQQVQALLECQTRMLGAILAALEELVGRDST